MDAINVKDPQEGVKKLFKILCNLFLNKRGSWNYDYKNFWTGSSDIFKIWWSYLRNEGR